MLVDFLINMATFHINTQIIDVKHLFKFLCLLLP